MIGANLDVTGYAAWLGEPELRAAQLFVEQINARGGVNGRPLQLIVYDNESNPEKATSNAKKLIQRDKVVAVVGPAITATSNAARSVAQEEKVITYSLSTSFEPNYPDSYSFATCSSTADMVEAVYDYFAKNSIKRVATLCATDSTGQTWFEETNKNAKKYRTEIWNERFNVKDMDVTAQLAKLKGNDPQALIVGASGAPNAVVVKNFNQLGFKIPYISGMGNVSETFLKLMKGNEPEKLLLTGAAIIVWRELPDSYPNKKLMKDFAESFETKFKREPDVYAADAYDAIRVITEGISKVNPEGPKDGTKLRDAMEKIKKLPAVYGGSYSFSREDHRGIGKEAVVLIQVKDGKFTMAR